MGCSVSLTGRKPWMQGPCLGAQFPAYNRQKMNPCRLPGVPQGSKREELLLQPGCVASSSLSFWAPFSCSLLPTLPPHSSSGAAAGGCRFGKLEWSHTRELDISLVTRAARAGCYSFLPALLAEGYMLGNLARKKSSENELWNLDILEK